MKLDTDISLKDRSAQEIISVVKAWRRGALNRHSMLDLFRLGPILPEGRSDDEETKLVNSVKRAVLSSVVSAAPLGGLAFFSSICGSSLSHCAATVLDRL